MNAFVRLIRPSPSGRSANSRWLSCSANVDFWLGAVDGNSGQHFCTGGVHRKAIRLLQDRKPRWLHVEWLPAYAPELNPVEHLWNHTKWSDLANFVPHDAEHLRQAAQQSLNDQRYDPQRLYSCFRAAQLT